MLFPGFIPDGNIGLSFIDLAITVAEVTSLVTAFVTSVCPPIISTFASSAAFASSSARVPISSSVAEVGASIVISKPIGSAPAAAASLQLTCTVSPPRFAVADVIGSVENTAIAPPKSIAAQSTPTFGEHTTSSLVRLSLSKTSLFKTSLSSLPALIYLQPS